MRCKDSAFSQMHKLDTPVSQLRHMISFVRSSLWLFGRINFLFQGGLAVSLGSLGRIPMCLVVSSEK